MVQEVYVDLYFLINFSMDLITLLITAALMHRRLNRWRAVIGAAIGGGYAVASLLLSSGGVLTLAADLAAAVVICTVTFWSRGGRLWGLLRLSLVFALTSMILGGVMTALYSALNRLELPFDALQGDGLSVWTFALLTAVASVATLSGGRLLGFSRKTRAVTLQVTLFGRSVTLRAMVDTGNLLRDPVSGRAVIVCDRARICPLLPPALDAAYRSGDFTACLGSYELVGRLRPIPARTAGGDAVLFALVPDSLRVAEERREGGEAHAADYLIAPAELGSSAAGFDAVIGIH
jgi:stage II sporulation protein GA (sporulation sigma-E factor processing peptidase)